LARTVSWRHRLPEIKQRIQNSVTETWSRKDVESVFEIKRAAAQLLIKAVGEIQNIGGTHLVDRASLLRFLESLEQSDNLETARRERILLSEPVPRPRHHKLTLPEDLRSVMVRDLPQEIVLSEGRLEITGRDSMEVLERLLLLSRALQNDLDTVLEALNPPPAPPRVEVDELRELFADLRRREATWRTESCSNRAGEAHGQFSKDRAAHVASLP
jgi:hypothetical protein